MTLLGVLSDTHGDVEATTAALRQFRHWEVDQIVHCGDIDSPEIVFLMEAWPTHFVLGNMDDPSLLEDAIRRAGQHFHGRLGHLELDGKRIAFLHGDDLRRLHRTILSGRWDLVCHGHTHQASLTSHGPTLVLNPGALYRTGLPAVAVVELPSLDITPILLVG